MRRHSFFQWTALPPEPESSRSGCPANTFSSQSGDSHLLPLMFNAPPRRGQDLVSVQFCQDSEKLYGARHRLIFMLEHLQAREEFLQKGYFVVNTAQVICVIAAAGPSWPHGGMAHCCTKSLRQFHKSEGRKWGVRSVVVAIWRYFGAPRSSLQRSPNTYFHRVLGTSGRKIGAPQKRQIQPRQI